MLIDFIQLLFAGQARNFFKALLVVVFIAAVASAGYFWYLGLIPKDHQIAGVPYEGGYTGSYINRDVAAAVYSIVQYWGDTRFTDKDVVEWFPYSYVSASSTNIDKVGYDHVEEILHQQGYETERIASNDMKAIKKMIASGVPVIVSGRLAPEETIDTNVMRLLIGYSDTNGQFEFHDNNFGNNYKIDYDTYNKLDKGNGALAVFPSEVLKPQLHPEVTRIDSYPARLGIMDSPGIRKIQIWWVEIDTLRQASEPDYETIAELWRKIIAEPAFEELHPAARFLASMDLGRIYTNYLGLHSDAISIFISYTIPMTAYDFSQPYGEWERNNDGAYDSPFWKTEPWVGIGVANLRLYSEATDETEKTAYLQEAENAFKKVLSIDPKNQDAIMFFAGDYDFALTS